jgi:hypothetical protein
MNAERSQPKQLPYRSIDGDAHRFHAELSPGRGSRAARAAPDYETRTERRITTVVLVLHGEQSPWSGYALKFVFTAFDEVDA